MRIATHSESALECSWPDPKDLSFVKATAALLGFSLFKDRGERHWRLVYSHHHSWYLYGTVKREIQGPWIPETDDEWILCLQRLWREIHDTDDMRWARYPQIFDEVFKQVLK